MSGRVFLVGAGCGGAELLTLRGQELLRTCDAVVYDALMDPALLDLVPAEAKRCPVGKRSGQHSAEQREIEAMLIALARGGSRVVRLKGGDPFVFGRGGEEVLALQRTGIPYEVVPGISSAIAIPELAGIPVTHRGMSQSVHIITAHTADTVDGLPADMENLAPLSGTLVFLMGLSRLEQIARRLTEAGRSPDTPAAVISGGNAPNPVTVRGTLKDIAEKTRKAGVQAPAVIVVGEVASLQLTYQGPLSGVRVGITGTEEHGSRLRRCLEDLGAETVWSVRSRVVPLPISFSFQSLADGAPRWLVFTSANGVRDFFRRLKEQKVDLRGLHACRFAVIGEATGDALWEYGIRADLCPETATTAALGDALSQVLNPGEQVVLFRARQGSADLKRALPTACAVREIRLYDTVADPQTDGRQTADYLTFSSAGGVDMFFEHVGHVPEGTVCVCIGPVTAAALRRHGVSRFLMAKEISAQGIAQSILEDVRARTEGI